MITMANITALPAATATSFIIDTPKYYNQFRQIQKLLVQITTPYIFIVTLVGFITNSATIVLLFKSLDSKNTKQNWTLIALALSDLVHNTALSIRVIHDTAYRKIESLCIIISFLSQLAEILSAAFTVLFTVQRYSAVRYPLQTATHNPSSPITTILLIFLSSLIFCIGLLSDNTHIDCHPELQLRWFIADALVSFIVPFTLIVLFNIRIITLIRHHARSSISKQSIHLQARKKHRKTDSKGNRSESQSVVYSADHGETVRITIPDVELNECYVPYLTSSKESRRRNSSSDPSVSVTASETASPNAFVFKAFQNKKKRFRRSRSSDRSSDSSAHTSRRSHTVLSIHVTRMLVLVSTCFLILNAPAHITVIVATIHSRIESPVFSHHAELAHFRQTQNLTDNQVKNLVFIQKQTNITEPDNILAPDGDQILIHLIYLAVVITQLISYLSYSVNFFLYSYSGIMFRSNFKQFLQKLC